MPSNCRVEQTLSKGGICSARATSKFARASLGGQRRGAAHAVHWAPITAESRWLNCALYRTGPDKVASLWPVCSVDKREPAVRVVRAGR